MPGRLPALKPEDFDDHVLRDQIQALKDFFRQETPLLGFRFFEVTFTAAQTNFKFKHSLGVIPKDIIQTSITNSATVTWGYALFTADNLDMTVSGPCTVRFFAGVYNPQP